MTNEATFEIDTDSRLVSAGGWTTDTTGPTLDAIWDSFSLPEMTFDTNGVLHVTGTNVTSIKWTVDQKGKTFLLDGGLGSGTFQISMIPNPEVETALGIVTVEDPKPATKVESGWAAITIIISIFLAVLFGSMIRHPNR